MENSIRLSDDARAALAKAEVLAYMAKADSIQTVHLLAGILDQEDSKAAKILREGKIDIAELHKRININPGVVAVSGGLMKPMSEALRLAMRTASNWAKDMGAGECSTTHLLLGVLSQTDSSAFRVLSDIRFDVDLAMRALEKLFNNGVSDPNSNYEKDEHAADISSTPFLDKFTTNLTKLAVEGKIDPVVGRDKEIDRLITILSRRSKNNPILIGEAGVGKTAVVEGLANRIAHRRVSERMADSQILEIDLAGLLAGTKYRGEFENRLKKLINEIERNPKAIAFVDEIHTLVGAGSSEDSMDAANILKPALSRGQFRLIGATTFDEYRKRIEKDPALVRRLQDVEVKPATTAETVRILTGLTSKFEEFHNVKITESAIQEAVRMSDRYLTSRYQPDKAIDVLDETAARVCSRQSVDKNEAIIGEYHNQIDKLTADINGFVAKEDYEKAAICKMQINQLNDKIEELSSGSSRSRVLTIKDKDVASTVSQMTGIPLEKMKKSDLTRLRDLEKKLSARVIGQSSAVEVVSQAIRRSQVGIGDPARPIGSFIFLGSTGVGKTELAKVLADEVFGSEKSLIRVDMSEYSERYTISRLLGAPAGYVGYGEGGQLTEKVRRQPYSVVLFDEIEKAHPDIFNVLLQIMEEGHLTDSSGRQVNFKNTVIILTSNIGSEELSKERLGFSMSGEEAIEKNDITDRQESVMAELQSSMRPELINRFDKIVLFNKLSDKEIGQIADLMIGNLSNRLLDKGIAITLTARMRRQLIKVGYDENYGARPMRRAIQDLVETVISDELIEGKIKKGQVIKVDYKKDKVVLTPQVEDKTLAENKKSTQAVKKY